jgi:2'-5' RNA ligase
LALPPPLQDSLAGMAAGLPNARWTPRQNRHVTLRFIGEVDEDVAQAIHDGLLAVHAPRFDLAISGVGTFDGGRRAFTLWAGVERSPALVHLHEKIESAVVRAGVRPEGRRFQPHITLARLKDPPLSRLQDYIAGHNLLRDTLRVTAFCLFSSHLGHGDPIYRAEAEYPLD